MGRRLRCACFVVGVGLLSTRHAVALEPATLRVSRDAATQPCPDEHALGEAVATRLGFDPFVPEAARRVTVAFRREGTDLFAAVRVEDEAGSGEKLLRSRRLDCSELAATTALTISILLDARTGLVPPRPPEPVLEPEIAPPAPPPPPKETALSPPPPAPLGFRASLVGGAGVGTAPSVSPTAALGVGLERRRWSLAVELRADLPAGATNGGYETRARLLAANLVPCGRFGWLFGCAVVTVGAIEGEVLGSPSPRQSTLHAMVGPRAGVDVPLTPWLSVAGHLEATFALTRTSLRVGSRELWSTEAVGGLFGIGAVLHFP